VPRDLQRPAAGRRAETERPRRWILAWLTGASAFACVLGLIASSGQAPAASGSEVQEEIRASWFAVGDTGWSSFLHRGRKHLADAIDTLDREHPADGLLLLGDNFYPTGLLDDDPEGQLIDMVVIPFCPFTELTARWNSGPPRCERRSERSRQIWAVLGNHDYGAPESPGLQRTWIETRIANWRMPDGDVASYSLAPGVDLVAYDSQHLIDAGGEEALTRALRAAAGPWRIVASHHPLRLDWETEKAQREVEPIRRAIAAAKVPVQLSLGGHEHNLQVLDLEEPRLGVQVIAGGGSRPRPVDGDVPARLVAFEGLGFVRIDLVGSETPRLIVTLFTVPSGPVPSSWPRPWPSRPQVAAAFEIDVEGNLSERRAD
jgi:hypothetical protein